MDISKQDLKHKIVYSFNKICINLISELKNSDDDLKKIIKKKFKVFDKLSSEHIERFYKQTHEFKDLFVAEDFDMSAFTNNEQFMESHLLKSLKTSMVLNKIPDTYHYVFFGYLHLLYLIMYIKQEVNEDNQEEMEQLFTRVLELVNMSNILFEEIDDIIDDDIKVLINKYHKLKNMNAIVTTGDDDEEASVFDMFKGSTIGDLAKEISEEIDLSKIENPQDLLNFSGDNSAVSDIISKVGTKIQSKIDSGQLNQKDLLGEAMSLVGKLGQSDDSDTSNMMANIMSAASSMGLGNIMNSEQVRASSTKERLRKKLEEKRKK